MKTIELTIINKNESHLKDEMSRHYSQPKGFVGRSIIYSINVDGIRYGTIVGGSSTLHLPGREVFFNGTIPNLNSIINNTFFHVEKVDGKYPVRNFTTEVVKEWRQRICVDWLAKYGDNVIAFETLVELPRSGELYLRDGWVLTGTTKGFTCKRVAGIGTDGWSGKRVWNKTELRPKNVFMRLV